MCFILTIYWYQEKNNTYNLKNFNYKFYRDFLLDDK